MHHYSARASKRATAARSSTACTTGPPLLPRRPSKIRSHARRRKATKVARSRTMPVPDAQGTWAVYTSTEVLHLSADVHLHMHMRTRHVGAGCHMPQRAPKSTSKNMAAAAARMSCTCMQHVQHVMCMCMWYVHVMFMCMCVCERKRGPTDADSEHRCGRKRGLSCRRRWRERRWRRRRRQ